MRNLQQLTLTAIAVTTMVAASGGQLSAEEPGIVRISDSARQGTTYQTQTQQASAQNVSYSNTTSSCRDGQCGQAGCSTCGNGCGECDGCKQRKFCFYLGCKGPTYGWGRPIKRPINRLPVTYQRYWPNGWHGQAGGGYTGVNVNYFPMVHTPTDTTQLGYYYQQVPFWRPNPDMVPPVPWPSQWHLREGQNQYGNNVSNGTCGANCNGNGSSVSPEPVPETNDTPVEPTQEPPPVPKTAQNQIQ